MDECVRRVRAGKKDQIEMKKTVVGYQWEIRWACSLQLWLFKSYHFAVL